MEHWSKTSTVEPEPLGRKLNKRKMEEAGNTSTDQCRHSRFQGGQKYFPIDGVPNEGFRIPVGVGRASALEIEIDNFHSLKFSRNMISNPSNRVNHKVMIEKDIITTLREDQNASAKPRFNEKEYHHPVKQNKFNIPKDQSSSSSEASSISIFTFAQGKRFHNNSEIAKEKVLEIVREFRACCDYIMRMDKENSNKRRRVDFLAAKLVKKKFHLYSDKPFLGPVPGVDIGDEFHYRMELNILGLHHPPRGGIEYVQEGGRIIATSIVDSGFYDNYKPNQDSLRYCGQGGNNANAEVPEDQKMEGRNLALMNCIEAKNHVRVIRGCKTLKASPIYFYDGLYIVEKMWVDKGLLGKTVFKFMLVRIPGQANFLDARNCGKMKTKFE